MQTTAKATLAYVLQHVRGAMDSTEPTGPYTSRLPNAGMGTCLLSQESIVPVFKARCCTILPVVLCFTMFKLPYHKTLLFIKLHFTSYITANGQTSENQTLGASCLGMHRALVSAL